MEKNKAVYDEIYGKLIGKIIVIFISSCLLVTILEIIVGIVFTADKQRELQVLEYFIKYVIVPASVDPVIIAVTLFLLKMKKLSSKIKNYVLVTSLWCIALVLSITHGYFVVMLAAFIIPVLTSTLFLDYKTFTYGIILSLAGVFAASITILYLEGNSDRSGKIYIWGSAIIAVLLVALTSVVVGLVVQIHRQREKVLIEMQHENAKLVKANRVDGLTGLQNHTSFYNVLENKLSKARRDRRGFALAMLDIDDFKNINDTYGHGIGDDILKYVSDTIVDAINKTGVSFRYGGDEFAIVFNNPNPEANVAALEVLRKSVANNDSLFSDGTRVTLSIGYYNVKEVQMTSEEIFFRADQALYQAKYNGKNQVHAEY
jgi:diguanylate cyclase (GGDEF)-like protein